ncbi:CDP-glucose 4,6-dehydratase [Ruegeria meonggei]|uniref:CDP-glucose 4,6-dehydratase n=2 Tax=Ruegeria meonggei TaxID=1446476 RepID=A0A1X7AC94_9RHOB|nr:CDP-glucose 4,6-dehydratase [Ruegeria meonggei]
MTAAVFSGRRVLVTGHTGFKGAWLAAWLAEAGARVTGYALHPETDPNLWALLDQGNIRSVTGDLNDRATLDRLIAETDPEFVFHLAAQSLVRRSYRTPVETFATNVLGTVQLLDALRAGPGLRAVVVATSDKAYENVEQVWGYRETDPMGGHDPYSASKGGTEIAAAAMRRSFFTQSAVDPHPARIATARAGNVIGGGDWAEDRLVPDIVRGCLSNEERVVLRHPSAIRPWQHVLEPLRGYMMLAQQLERDDAFARGWNFGPERDDERPVLDVAEAVIRALGQGRIEIDTSADTPHEANMLRLDVSQARAALGWRPVLSFEDTVRLTADWYAGWARGTPPTELCHAQIAEFETLSKRQV